MIHREQLPLHEEVMLLALRDEEGTIAPGTMYQYALGGAILAELLLRGRIAVDDSGRKKRARVVDATPLGAPVLDECLALVGAAKRPKPLSDWVGKFARVSKLKHRVAERLVDRGILRDEEGKILLLFSRRIYPESDPRPERALTGRLERAIFTDALDVDPRTVVLVSLANSAGLLRVVFDKKELKRRKGRIEQIVNGEVTGKAAAEAIEAMQAAMMVAVIMPAVITTTVTS